MATLNLESNLVLSLSKQKLQEHLFSLAGNKEFIPIDSNITDVFSDRSISFIERSAAEISEDYIHIIPYIIVQHGDAVASYFRNGSEERLHRKRSIGFGGHCTLQDYLTGRVLTDTSKLPSVIEKTIAYNIYRELGEEIPELELSENFIIPKRIFQSGPELKFKPNPVFQGYLYSPRNPVGKVHLGLVFKFDITEICPQRPTKIAEGYDFTWINLEINVIPKSPEDVYEDWSDLVIQNITFS